MLIPFVMRDKNGALVSQTPTATVDGVAVQVSGTQTRWEVDALPGSVISITGTNADPIDIIAPMIDPADIATISKIESSSVLAKEASATSNTMSILGTLSTLATKAEVEAIGGIEIDSALIADAVGQAVGGELGKDIADEILSRMSLHESLSMGPGVGSTKYEDNVKTFMGRPADGAVVRVFKSDGTQVDFNSPVAGTTADAVGNYYLMLDPGFYGRRIWYKRLVVIDDIIEVQ